MRLSNSAKMLLILIFLAYFSFSNGLYLGTSIDRSNINQSIKSLQLALQDNNNCEIKLFNEPNFRGDNIGVTKAKERFIYDEKTRHSIDRSIGFSDVQSLQIVGHCCWAIYSQMKKWDIVGPNKRAMSDIEIPTPFSVYKTPCQKRKF